MSISYIRDIPFATHNPSTDQPNMLINTNATFDWAAIDHISFNAGAGLVSGQHKQVTFNGFNPAVTQTTPNSVAFTNSTTSTPAGQLFWTNSNATYQISPIRAWGTFPGAAPVITQSVNVASIVRNSVGNYTVTLNANVLGPFPANTYAVIPSCSGFIESANYSITDATHFNIVIGPSTDPASVSFIVLQL